MLGNPWRFGGLRREGWGASAGSHGRESTLQRAAICSRRTNLCCLEISYSGRKSWLRAMPEDFPWKPRRQSGGGGGALALRCLFTWKTEPLWKPQAFTTGAAYWWSPWRGGIHRGDCHRKTELAGGGGALPFCPNILPSCVSCCSCCFRRLWLSFHTSAQGADLSPL